MQKQGTYYLGRILKYGLLTSDVLVESIKNPLPIYVRKNAWTFTDVIEHKDNIHHYVFGVLSKYSPDGEVVVVDTVERTEKKQNEPNLRIASSPFVYIPSHSGVAFLHVPNNIEQHVFVKRFCEIIKHTNENFFVDCEIESISDLRTFASKLRQLDRVYRIDARVSPPNPLFGPLWKSLESYLRNRNTDKLTLVEDAPESEGIATRLPELVDRASRQTEEEIYIPDFDVAIGDAAILMAADGYGNGRIRGSSDGGLVVIKTSETTMNFSFEKEPESYDLYMEALSILENIERSRHMEHLNE